MGAATSAACCERKEEKSYSDPADLVTDRVWSDETTQLKPPIEISDGSAVRFPVTAETSEPKRM